MSKIIWQTRWLDLVDLVASWSEDQHTKIGAVIVNDRNVVLSIGWNGLPRGVNGNVLARHERPLKYGFFEHAERNAILNAAAHGIALLGSTMYTQYIPCADCGRALIQSGIKHLVVKRAFYDERWKPSELIAQEMMLESGLTIQDISLEE
jgi:dCMP deaminase